MHYNYLMEGLLCLNLKVSLMLHENQSYEDLFLKLYYTVHRYRQGEVQFRNDGATQPISQYAITSYHKLYINLFYALRTPYFLTFQEHLLLFGVTVSLSSTQIYSEFLHLLKSLPVHSEHSPYKHLCNISRVKHLQILQRVDLCESKKEQVLVNLDCYYSCGVREFTSFQRFIENMHCLIHS